MNHFTFSTIDALGAGYLHFFFGFLVVMVIAKIVMWMVSAPASLSNKFDQNA